MSRVHPPLLVAIVLAMLTGAPASASAGDLAVGAKIGANWSLLTKPVDPVGEPSLLSGSAFDGTGFVGGATVHYQLAEVKGAVFELEGGLLFSHHSAVGFEEDADTGERRDITLGANMVRMPMMVHLRRGAGTGVRLGLGIEPLFGLQSGAVVDPGPQKLTTIPATHVGLSVALGFDYQINHVYSVPVEYRVTWDPFVGESTTDRFDGFRSSDDPGSYQVAYDWQMLFMTGIRYEL